MKSLKKYIAQQFGKPTGFGGTLMTFVMNRQNGKQYNSVSENIHMQATDTVLDIGFGNGYMIKKLLKCNPNKIYGIDISDYMLAKVSHKNATDILNGKLDLRLADVKKLPFENNLFDKVYTINTIYFWDNADSSFAEIKRTLKHGGIFLNVFYTKAILDKISHTQYGYSKYRMEEVISMTEKSGLKILEVKEIQPSDSFCIVAQKI